MFMMVSTEGKGGREGVDECSDVGHGLLVMRLLITVVKTTVGKLRLGQRVLQWMSSSSVAFGQRFNTRICRNGKIYIFIF